MVEQFLDFQNKAPDVLQGAQNTNHATGIASIIGTLLSVTMTVGMLLLLFYLIMGGFAWLTSNGDKGKTEEARNKITTAVIGMLILASVLALVLFIQYILGIQVFTFGVRDPSSTSGTGSSQDGGFLFQNR
jgi:cytochrome bd-type quinol oxidase subunit 2